MGIEYKKIVLAQLQTLDDRNFKIIKSLLDKDLKLTHQMQEEYDIIKIANLLADKFPKDAGVNTLIEVCEDMPSLENLADKLKQERTRVKNENRRKRNAEKKKRKQDEASTSQPEPTRSETSNNTQPAKKKKKKSTETKGLKKMKLNQEDDQPLKPSVLNTQERQDCPQSPCIPPLTTPSNPAKKKKGNKPIKTEDSKKLTQEQNQLPEPSVTRVVTSDFLNTPDKPLPTLSSSSLTKKQEKSIKKITIMSQKSQIAKPSATSIDFSESQFQTPPRPPPKLPSDSSSKKPKRGNVPTEPSEEDGFHEGPKQVMVLKVTEPFTYDMVEEKQMFHATVATETEFFRVKVFSIVLRKKFHPNKVIAISDYFGRNGFLEIYREECISETDVQLDVTTTLKTRARATPKIVHLFSKQSGIYVNGQFQVHEKRVANDFTYYGIQDDTGRMEVVVYGRLTNINCEPGNSLRLFCFELALCASSEKWQLKSVKHSYMQVIKHKKNERKPLNPDSTMEATYSPPYRNLESNDDDL